MNTLEKPYGFKLRFMSKIFKHAVKEECAKKGIKATFSNVIMCVACCEDGVSQNDICEYSHLAKPTISLTLKEMEALGYITREQSSEDNRKTIVKLTDLGKEIDIQIRECFHLVEERMIKNISNDDLEYFNNILEAMRKNLQEGKDKTE
jgi:DNA-binding MarR family transcriptional regulator